MTAAGSGIAAAPVYSGSSASMRAPCGAPIFISTCPDALIARHPAPERSASRLLHLDGATGAVIDRQFRDLPHLLRPGDLLVFNDTRVIPARLHGRKHSGGRIELLLERALGGRRALVQLKSSKPSRPGTLIDLAGATATVLERQGDFWLVEFDADAHEVFERLGEMPLPPYVDRPAEAADRERYQTVYAREPGAVAAPTAGLHFDAALLQACRDAGAEFAYVTLHVGAGTFQPVRVDDIAEHRMHAEVYEVPATTCAAVAAARRRGGRVIAVGTTAVRSLESAAARRRVARLPGRDAAVHHARQAVSRRRRAWSPIFTCPSRPCSCWSPRLPAGARAGRLSSCGGGRLPLLQLRRRDVRRAGAGGTRAEDRCMNFELLGTEGAARRGRLHLNHGIVETPVFMPVGTYGTVKAMTPEELRGSVRRSSSATRST